MAVEASERVVPLGEGEVVEEEAWSFPSGGGVLLPEPCILSRLGLLLGCDGESSSSEAGLFRSWVNIFIMFGCKFLDLQVVVGVVWQRLHPLLLP